MTDHRKEAEHWLTMASSAPDGYAWASVCATIAHVHALLASLPQQPIETRATGALHPQWRLPPKDPKDAA